MVADCWSTPSIWSPSQLWSASKLSNTRIFLSTPDITINQSEGLSTKTETRRQVYTPGGAL